MSTETEATVTRIREVKAEFASLSTSIKIAEVSYQKEAKALTVACETALEAAGVPEWARLKELNRVRTEKLAAAQARAKELQAELAKLTDAL